MRYLSRAFALLLSLAALTLPAFAQEVVEAAPETLQGLGLMMLLFGGFVLVVVGVLLSQREANGEEDDLV